MVVSLVAAGIREDCSLKMFFMKARNVVVCRVGHRNRNED